jgi:hypothetical protein
MAGIMHLGGQLPCHADCIWLEVVSKAEVAKHLKEAMVSSSYAHILQVIGAYALLRGCRPAVLPLSLLCESTQCDTERLTPAALKYSLLCMQDFAVCSLC